MSATCGCVRHGCGRRTDGVGRVVISLNVCVAQRLVEALNHGLDVERRLVRERIGQDVTGGDIYRLLEQIVLQDDETVVNNSRVADDALPVVEHLLRRDGAAVDIEV